MEQYVIRSGKLTTRKSSFISFFFKTSVLIIVSAISFGSGYKMAEEEFALQQGNVIISDDQFQHYLAMENAFAIKIDSSFQDQNYVLSHEQLRAAFDHTFPEININDELKSKYIDSAARWGAEFSIPPLLILSVIWRESSFDANTHSHANARGPMQVIYRYHSEKLDRIGKGEQDLHDVDIGIRIGTEILREYFNRNERNIFGAMRAYVGGAHSTYAPDILARYFNARMFIEEQIRHEEQL